MLFLSKTFVNYEIWGIKWQENEQKEIKSVKMVPSFETDSSKALMLLYLNRKMHSNRVVEGI